MTDRINNGLPSLSCDSSASTVSNNGSDKSIALHACINTESDDDNKEDAASSIVADNNNNDENEEFDDEEDDGDDLPEALPEAMLPMSRLLRSCSVASTESPHCPICLDPMTPIDHQHPLQCPTKHCHFNFCMSCVQSLLSSSKDDFEMASDGNNHVKIYLNCPNCRADHSTTIRDVLLLRKVDMVLWLLAQQGKDLSASQQRTQAAMKELHVQEAIQHAREKEVEFWKTHHRRDSMTFRSLEDLEDVNSVGEHKSEANDDSSMLVNSSLRKSMHRYESSRRLRDGSFSYEEWGVEADLDNGVHSSFRGMSTRTSSSSMGEKFGSIAASNSKDSNSPGSKPSSFRKPLDETLLQGLERLMTHAEQLQVTNWMTMGDPDRLAQAAHLLRKIEDDTKQGVMPADRQKAMNRRGSVYEIVDETRQLDNGTQQPATPNNNRNGNSNVMDNYTRRMTPRQRNQIQMQKQRQENLQLQMAMAARASLLEECPLPVRMPKAITLDLNQDPDSRWFPLRFCNDSWDGTVLDAYTKLTVNPVRGRALAAAPENPWTVTKKTQTSHTGVFHVLSEGQYQRHYGQIEMTRYGEQPPRVLVAAVQGTAGRQGVMKGDVVTHIDGYPLEPHEQTADALVALLRARRNDGQDSVQIVLNAEASIAEALKRRAAVIEKRVSE